MADELLIVYDITQKMYILFFTYFIIYYYLLFIFVFKEVKPDILEYLGVM